MIDQMGGLPIQRNLDRLEKWANRNLMKFKREQCQVLHVRRNNPMLQHMLGANCLERHFAEKDMGFLVDNRLDLIQQVCPSGKGGQLHPELH